MGIQVRLDMPAGADIRFLTAIRQGLYQAGTEVLAVSDGLAPTEPDPRHGEHMTATGFVRVIPGATSDTILVGYGAFWSVLQNEHTEWNHPHGGGAKFLDRAIFGTGEASVNAQIAAAVREAFA